MDHLPEAIRHFLRATSDAVGLNIMLTTYVILLSFNVLIAFGFKRVRIPFVRSCISLAIGLIWLCFLYNINQTAILLFLTTVVYFVIMSGYLAPSTFTGTAIAGLSGFHIYRMIDNYMGWSLDITCPLMLFTAKFSMFAYDVYDGSRLKRALPLSPDSQVSETRSRTCLLETPSLFEFYVYIFDFLGVLAGPVFHIREYLDFVYLRNDFAKIVDSWQVVWDRFSSALAIGAMFAVAGLIPQLSYAFVQTTEHRNSALVVRLVSVQLITFASRLRYYFAWYMADIACVIAGIGYNPSSRDKHSRSQNAIVSKVDFLANCQSEAFGHWNISISKWLRSCIYLRAHETPVPAMLAGVFGHRQYATLLTRFTSAFWHGFYPGYYLCFFSTVLHSEADSVARKFIRPLFTKTGQTKPNWIYTIAGKIHTSICINYYGSAFLVLSAAAATDIWSGLYFCVHIFNILTIILVPVIGKKLLPRRSTDKKQQ